VQLLLDAKPLSSVLTTVKAPGTTAEVAATGTENTVTPKALADNEVITKQTRDWASAWERKDVDAYLGFYADSFVPEKFQTIKAWAAHRRNRIMSAGQISLVLQEIKVDVAGTKATSEFLQQYQTPTYKDSVTKVLSWELINNRWVIVREATK
jgi:adhesin transport system outer membrane protein